MRFTKNHTITNTSVFVTIVCLLTMALVVFLQEDEDVPSVNRNLKFFCETAPEVKLLLGHMHKEPLG